MKKIIFISILYFVKINSVQLINNSGTTVEVVAVYKACKEFIFFKWPLDNLYKLPVFNFLYDSKNQELIRLTYLSVNKMKIDFKSKDKYLILKEEKHKLDCEDLVPPKVMQAQ